MSLPMCACARTREYCLTKGCKKEEINWRFTTEGRPKDRLRRIVDTLGMRPVSRWLSPEKAISHAWLMNIERYYDSSYTGRTLLFMEKIGDMDIETPGVP